MKNLKKLRKAKNISQVELANMMNTSQANISKWESFEVSLDLATIHKLTTILDCTVEQLLGVEDKDTIVISRDFFNLLIQVRDNVDYLLKREEHLHSDENED